MLATLAAASTLLAPIPASGSSASAIAAHETLVFVIDLIAAEG